MTAETDLHARVVQALELDIAPALGLVPEDLTLLEVNDGIATIRLGAGCAGCGGIPALVAAIEQELRARVPEVDIVEVVA